MRRFWASWLSCGLSNLYTIINRYGSSVCIYMCVCIYVYIHIYNLLIFSVIALDWLRTFCIYGCLIYYYSTKLVIIPIMEFLSISFILLWPEKPLIFSLAMSPHICIPALLWNSFCHFSTVSSDQWHSFVFCNDASNDWFYLSPLIHILQIYFPSITYYYTVLFTSNGGKKNNTEWEIARNRKEPGKHLKTKWLRKTELRWSHKERLVGATWRGPGSNVGKVGNEEGKGRDGDFR